MMFQYRYSLHESKRLRAVDNLLTSQAQDIMSSCALPVRIEDNVCPYTSFSVCFFSCTQVSLFFSVSAVLGFHLLYC